jgi:hypothetical protein
MENQGAKHIFITKPFANVLQNIFESDNFVYLALPAVSALAAVTALYLFLSPTQMKVKN